MNATSLNATYLDTHNVWFYDNDIQCESHKGNDNEHIGNPWHCLAHLEYWYRISKAKHVSIDKYNTTLVMSQFTDRRFGADVPNYHLFSPFFGNIINKDGITHTAEKSGSAAKNKLYYIKELYLDERSPKGWGCSIIWAPKPDKSFFQDECESMQEPRRSHVLHDMRRDMMNYYDLNHLYRSYDWIHELRAINGSNAWNVHGELRRVANGTAPLVVVATRYVNGRCRYRCVRNMKDIKDVLVRSLGHQYVIVYGNPGTLTFRAQYHLFKSTRIFVGVHGAVFVMASLFMPLNNLKFEICLAAGQKGWANSEIVVRAFGGENVSYASYVCKGCVTRAGARPDNVSVDAVIAVFQETVLKLYNMSLVV